jgi:hypothetical protein
MAGGSMDDWDHVNDEEEEGANERSVGEEGGEDGDRYLDEHEEDGNYEREDGQEEEEMNQAPQPPVIHQNIHVIGPGPQPPVVHQPTIQDEPFMRGWDQLHHLMSAGRREVYDYLVHKSLDVDRWELVMSPEEYLNRFDDTLATVQLINRAPKRQLKRTYHRGPAFNRWLLLAQTTHQLWVDVKYKDEFFQHLSEYQTAQPGPMLFQASTGTALITTGVFIRCLVRAGCDTIRIKAFGQKMPLIPRFMPTEPAQRNHRWAVHNEWDIGKNFDSQYIWLFNSALGKQAGLKRYPMIIPGSRDFGTANITMTYRNKHYSIKIYPRMVHVIKSFNSHLQTTVPRTLHGLKIQLQAALTMIHKLTSKDAGELGGFRIEVTVGARTLAEAMEKVNATPFMDPGFWLNQGEGPFSPIPLSARLVTRENLLANANWIYQKAINDNLFTGANGSKPTSVQVKVLADVYNALGWNPGSRTSTKSLDPTAWWMVTPAPASEVTELLHSLNTSCQSDEHIRLLFTVARTQNGSIPCKKKPTNARHRYQINNPAPFIIRCGYTGCNSKLQRSAVIQHIAGLVESAAMDKDTLMNGLEEGLRGAAVEEDAAEHEEQGSEDERARSENDEDDADRSG